MKILIDGDGCPVIRETIELAEKYNIKAMLVCDTAHMFDYACLYRISKVLAYLLCTAQPTLQ